MKIDCVYDNNNDYYFLKIKNKFKISDMITELSIEKKEYIKILKKYGAILIQEEYFFTLYDAALICMNSEELMPYRIMMEVNQ